MRVTRRTDERGVVGGIAALCLAVFFAMSALVIDVGNSWQQRRTAITATDAAALAAAQDFLNGSNGCVSTAETYLAANEDTATMTSCQHVAPSGSSPGRVTVEAEIPVTFIFAPIIGIDDDTVSSSTTVMYDNAGSINEGIRPFGLCLDTLLELGAQAGDGVTYHLKFGKDDPSNCGGAAVPGNWGILDFDGGSNSQSDIQDWTENGYDGEVAIGDVIAGTPGAFNGSLASALDELLLLDSFTVPIYQNATGNGSLAWFTVVDFGSVRLRGFGTRGAQDLRFLDLEFLDGNYQGGGGGSATGYGAFVLGVCAVDGINAATACI